MRETVRLLTLAATLACAVPLAHANSAPTPVIGTPLSIMPDRNSDLATIPDTVPTKHARVPTKPAKPAKVAAVPKHHVKARVEAAVEAKPEAPAPSMVRARVPPVLGVPADIPMPSAVETTGSIAAPAPFVPSQAPVVGEAPQERAPDVGAVIANPPLPTAVQPPPAAPEAAKTATVEPPPPAAPAPPPKPAMPAQPAPPVAQAPLTEASGHGEFEPVIHARGAKIGACMDNLVAQSAAVIDSKHTALSTWSTAAPDNNLFESIVGLSYPNKGAPNGAAILIDAPLQPGHCAGTTVQIYPTSQSCGTVQALLIKQGHTIGTLQALPVVDTKGYRNILMPAAGGGCVVVAVGQR